MGSVKNIVDFVWLILPVVLAGLSPTTMSAAEWYDSVPAVQEDAYSFGTTFSGVVGNTFDKGFLVGGSIASGKFHAILSTADYVRIVAAGDAGEQWSRYSITTQNADTYRNFFAQKSEGLHCRCG